MKRIYTLFIGLIAALAIQAQSDFPLQFADKDGNIIADGTTLNLTETVANDFGDVMMPTHLFVKNISDSEVHGGGSYAITSIGSGAFQTCFPENCVQQRNTGAYETEQGTFAAGVLKDMQTEWLPTTEGSCSVTYRLITFKQNPITKKWNKDKEGPTITLSFNYNSAGIDSATTGTNVLKVEYYSLTGHQVKKVTHGLYIMKTTYADGTEKCKKRIIK